MRYKHWMLASLSACTLAAAGWANAQAPFSRIVVFGTSLSDSGNAFVLTGQQSTAPDYGMDAFSLLIPDAAYAAGGLHFSNGATWVEQLARSMGMAASVGPALRGSSDGASNYAVGGARARDAAGGFNLLVQVGAFLSDVQGVAPSDALYVVEMGGNDIRDAVETAAQVMAMNGGFPAGLSAGLAAGSGVIDAAVGGIVGKTEMLRASGARRFLVWRAPDLSLTPAVRMLDSTPAGAGAALLAQFFSAEFNAKLDAALTGAPLVSRLDVYTLLHQIVGFPGAVGLTNATSACITPGVAPYHCTNADSFLFWDGIHPTKAAHGIVARAAAMALMSP
jgi:phospholipase/lecithinase/hemolysin